MLGESNPEGNAIVQEAVDALKAQTRVIEQAAVALGIESLEIEGSDSLDNPAPACPARGVTTAQASDAEDRRRRKAPPFGSIPRSF